MDENKCCIFNADVFVSKIKDNTKMKSESVKYWWSSASWVKTNLCLILWAMTSAKILVTEIKWMLIVMVFLSHGIDNMAKAPLSFTQYIYNII